MNLRLDWCSHEAAKYAVENWHYSKSAPFGKTVKIGAWEGNSFIGAVMFSPGISNNLGKPYGLESIEVTELVRVALNNEHITPTSKIVSIAIRLLKQQSEGLRLIVSFADTNQNHLGIIYQATNWVYAGMTPKSVAYLAPNGKIYHSRMVNTKGYKVDFGRQRKCYTPEECKKIYLPGKHRYLMPLDKEMRKQIEPLRQPYPKRPKQATSPIQGDSGGAAPTRTLQ